MLPHVAFKTPESRVDAGLIGPGAFRKPAPAIEPRRWARPAGWTRAPWPLVWLLVAGAIGASAWSWLAWRTTRPLPLAYVAPRPAFVELFDQRPLEIVTTEYWQKVPQTLPVWQFLADHTIWRRMHFEDWDRLPGPLRVAGLARLLDRYGSVMTAREAWPTMTADDWDRVPQPVRAMATLGMIETWVSYYDVGGEFALSSRDVAETLQAIAMSESWFDHRAMYVNADGSADLGIGGASAYARDTVRRWYSDGRADFTLADDEYFNPWLAARWMAFWFQVMLNEADGDLALAVRAYHRGIVAAKAGDGRSYREAVDRRRRQYIRGGSRSPTWQDLLAARKAS